MRRFVVANKRIKTIGTPFKSCNAAVIESKRFRNMRRCAQYPSKQQALCPTVRDDADVAGLARQSFVYIVQAIEDLNHRLAIRRDDLEIVARLVSRNRFESLSNHAERLALPISEGSLAKQFCAPMRDVLRLCECLSSLGSPSHIAAPHLVNLELQEMLNEQVRLSLTGRVQFDIGVTLCAPFEIPASLSMADKVRAHSGEDTEAAAHQGTTLPMSDTVVVVGAGLSGLVCARALKRAGKNVVVVDASDSIGGRMRTDHWEGWSFDRGFQVVFDSYPHVQSELDLDAMEVAAFEAGAQVWDGKKLHMLLRDDAFDMAFSKLFAIGDKTRMLSLTQDVAEWDYSEVWSRHDESANNFLLRYGFSQRFFQNFARPFFGGVFLDDSLNVSNRMFLFMWKVVSEGYACIPKNGIQAIPEQVAAGLDPQSIRLNCRVTRIAKDGDRVTGAVMENGETISASSVVVATDADSAAALAGVSATRGSRSTTCVYFAIPEKFVYGNYLVLNGSGEGLVHHIVPVSNLCPEFAPPGMELISVNLNGIPYAEDRTLLRNLMPELERWSPGAMSAWQHLRTYRIPHAQMAMPPGFMDHMPKSPFAAIQLAGEIVTNSSIDGVIESGLRAADEIAARVDPVTV